MLWLDANEADHGRVLAHAAKLLGMLGDAQAVPVLLRMLAGYAVIDGYHQAAEDALVALGAPAIEACLEAYPTAKNEDLRSGIVAVLSRSTENCAHFPDPPGVLCAINGVGAIYSADYGDPQAIPVLSQMFDALPIDDHSDSVMSNHIFVELRSAIEHLGGQLTANATSKGRPRRCAPASLCRADG